MPPFAFNSILRFYKPLKQLAFSEFESPSGVVFP
jgi:hypothetical protein